jgi:adenosylmethionine-8-amino-7-oxononanoate aminotransferase
MLGSVAVIELACAVSVTKMSINNDKRWLRQVDVEKGRWQRLRIKVLANSLVKRMRNESTLDCLLHAFRLLSNQSYRRPAIN